MTRRMTLHVDVERLGWQIVRRAFTNRRVHLRMTTNGSSYHKPTRTLRWKLTEGITLLLHEAAHALLDHKPTKDRSQRLTYELQAWMWTEEACHLWGLPFDYKRADRYFSTYTSWVPGAEGWRIRWRHK